MTARDGSFTNNFVLQALGGEWLPESDDYAHKLRDEGYTTPAMVRTLSEEDLKFCGIEKRAHVRAFLLFIQKLAANEASVVDLSASAAPSFAPALPLNKRSSPGPASASSGGRSPPRYEKRHQDDRPRAYDRAPATEALSRRSTTQYEDAARDAYGRPAYRDERAPSHRDEPRAAAQPAAASRPAAPTLRVEERQPPQPNRTQSASSWKPTSASSGLRAPPATNDKPKPAVLTTRPSFSAVAPRVSEHKPVPPMAARFETRLHYPMAPVDEPAAARPVRRTASSLPSTSSPSQPVEDKSVAAKVNDVLGGVRF